MLDGCLRALRWRVGVTMLGVVDAVAVDMVYSSSQHCGGEERRRGRVEAEGQQGGC